MGFPRLLTGYFLCQLLVPFPSTLILCLGLGLFLFSDLKKKKVFTEYNEVVVSFISDGSNAIKRMVFSKWKKICFWGAFMMMHHHWMDHVRNPNVSELLLYSAYNTQNTCKAFLTCTHVILRRIKRNHSLVCYRGCHLAYAVPTQRAQFVVTGQKSCCCWQKKCNLGTSWKLHVVLHLVLKCEAYLHSHESIAYGGRRLQHMIVFT